MKRISWHTPEYLYHERTSDWYWALGILATAGAITAILLGNILFAVIIAIGAFAIALHASRKPNIIRIEIHERGIAVGRDLYPYRSLHSFWVDDEHHAGMRLVIRSERAFAPLITFPISPETDVESVKSHLKRHIKEEIHEDSITNRIIDRLGF